MARSEFLVLLNLSLLVFGSSCANEQPAEDKPTGAAKMVLVPGGSFRMGTEDPHFADASPLHTVTLKPFYLDEHEVTNAAFAAFVEATHYVTVAERKPNPRDFPGVPEAQLVAGSAVFARPNHQVSRAEAGQWWQYVPGANWRRPLGPGSSVTGHANDPVVQVCYDDAQAYARWAGKRLPTEAEWECAARAGQRSTTPYYWGLELTPNGRWMANLFQGDFPAGNTRADGFDGVAPVKSFSPNAWGFYDMEGNVWEWCSDYYRPDYYRISPSSNPAGPADSHDPEEPGLVKHVQRGGSFLCSDQYCLRYQAGSRGKGEVKSAANNLGFRCAKDAK
ncbi:formylglycine-generating enzyme family protein [Hymenobacter negativus]|uniref:Formylglycine-generating enzyme family protein n=1 Tax=Hymenobacter negativus TaxID=2795026 RepID=A0ABS3QIV4_9BACT|nr:formylglycine-generating enzyme family protein [Hymenobacter negativus]MBO2011177.1 formylglycine-generating enzyme family protein [Hymenobacter negativus]